MTSEAFTRWSQACVDALGVARAEIDALNVFPVPDSDTGTNVYLTFVAGRDSIAAYGHDAPVNEVIATYVDGLLMGAKGNSGVILSQLLRAAFGEFGKDATLEPTSVAHGFEVAADAAYAAVGEPKEGTILSVARAAAVGAREAAAAGKASPDVYSAAAVAARAALTRTPDQMELLRRAGVVDAGGRALVVVLDVTERALTGRFDLDSKANRVRIPVPTIDTANRGDDLTEGGPAYEVMYLLKADETAIGPLREQLAGLGDSLVVVGGDQLWNVHVHVDDVGAAIEAGIGAGVPYRIAVTHFADQIDAVQRVSGRAVIAAATGEGLSALFAEAGARVLEFSRDRPITVDQMTAAFVSSRAEEIIVLPNNPRLVAIAEAAAQGVRADGVRIAVLPTLAQVQGLAALAVHDSGRRFDDAVVAMSSASGHVQHGALTVATEPGITMAGPCQAGDVLGVIAGDFAVVGSEPEAVAIEVLDRIVSPSAEMVTLVVGADAHTGLTDTLERHLTAKRPEVDMVVYDGGQENYSLFIAVE